MRRRNHYWIGPSKADSFVYCYIRKNACSAFKRLIRATSPYKDEAPRRHMLPFMGRRHRVRLPELLETSASRVVIWREPVARALSGFISRCLVTQDRSVRQQLNRTLSCDPRDVTFADFVRYLREADQNNLNVHFQPQFWHVAPVPYTVIDMTSLETGMAQILGPDQAKQFFGYKPNESAHLHGATHDRGSQRSIAELRAMYERGVPLPPTESFLNEELVAELQSLFAKDLEIYNAVSGRMSLVVDFGRDAVIRDLFIADSAEPVASAQPEKEVGQLEAACASRPSSRRLWFS